MQVMQRQERRRSRRGGVVVGTDGSPTATKAVEAAARLAMTSGQELVVAYGYRPKGAGALSADWNEVPEDHRWRVSPGAWGESVIQRAVAFARQVSGPDLRVRGHCEPGEPSRVLLDLVEDLHAGAVVVGNVGLGGWAERWTVPGRVARRATCEVFVVDTEEWAQRNEPPELPTSLLVRRLGSS
jgi:nucleotide-binding universal stress UspA family protein